MKKILTSEQMRMCDTLTIESGVTSSRLMEKAAKAVAEVAVSSFDPTRTLAVCGGGNNGGDGVLTALLLSRAGYSCDIYFVGDRDHTTAETAKRISEAQEEPFITFADNPDFDEYTLIIDAVFGIGLTRPVSGVAAEAIYKMNSTHTPVLAVDIPSGISADSGRRMGAAVMADATVAIETYKRGHALSDGINFCGTVYAKEIGISTQTVSGVPVSFGKEDLSLIPKRKRDANKGTYGRVLVVGGSVGMCGAAFLSAFAAYRTGAGIVEIFTPSENRPVLQTLLPEAVVCSYDWENPDISALESAVARATTIVIGPGLGKSKTAEILVKKVFECANAPLIADADALNITAEKGIPFPTEVPVIVTPHPGEMSRLTGRQIRELAADPWSVAKAYAAENEVICVLKFARTVISDGEKVFVNMSGGPSLAKGGSGDVLTGVIAGMLCSDLSPIDAAAMGVYIHGAAGDLTAEKMGDYSPVARDVINAIPEVLKGR